MTQALKQPPEGFDLLDAGQIVRPGDISRSPITDAWSPVNDATHGHAVTELNARHNIFARAAMLAGKVLLTDWLVVPGADHCAMRCLYGTDPLEVKNRVAFIEKTPRVRVGAFTEHDDFKNWNEGPKGCAPEYGEYAPSRAWCDEELLARGYTFGSELQARGYTTAEQLRTLGFIFHSA